MPSQLGDYEELLAFQQLKVKSKLLKIVSPGMVRKRAS